MLIQQYIETVKTALEAVAKARQNVAQLEEVDAGLIQIPALDSERKALFEAYDTVKAQLNAAVGALSEVVNEVPEDAQQVPDALIMPCLAAYYKTVSGAQEEALRAHNHCLAVHLRHIEKHDAERLTVPKGYTVPKEHLFPTFIEARETAISISNGRDLHCWSPLDGLNGMLHETPAKGKRAHFQTRFFPSALFQQWHGGLTDALLKQELQHCDFDSVMLFYSCLSWALNTPGMRVNTSLDALISAIGQDENARQGEREQLRLKVWRNLLVFDSLEVIGARSGVWREPAAAGEKRAKMDGDKLHSTDALLRILGRRDTADAPPKDVVLVVGEWATQFQGNREVISDLGNLRLIAGIPARQAAGAWARCGGLGLLQKWREESASATPIKRKNGAGETEVETLRFAPITRRQLLLSALRPNHDVSAILGGNDPQRAKKYWEQTVRTLQEVGLIGYYKELAPLPEGRWKEAWLDQPLDIRPKGEILRDAKQINAAKVKAQKRGARKKPPETT